MKGSAVCFIGRNLLDGIPEGHHIASSNIIQAALQAGVNAKVVTIGKCANRMPARKRAEFYCVSAGTEPLRTANLPAFYMNEAVSSTYAIMQARQLNCEIIHYLNITKEVASLVKMILRVRKSQVAHLYHSASAFLQSNFKLRLFSIRTGLFDNILTTNKSLLRYLTGRLGVNNDRVHYVPFPIDTDRFKMRDAKKLRKSYSLSSDSPTIVYIGAIYPDRGVFVLLKAFKKILKQMPEALLYVYHSKLKGDEEIYSPYFDRLARSREFRGHVIIQGPHPKIEEIYCLADVVALPFTQPYWITDPPLVLLEAMASGAPIVTTPVGAITEIASNKKNVVFSRPGDVSSLAKALCWTLVHADEARQLSLNARKVIEKEFTMQIVGKQLKSIYENITK